MSSASPIPGIDTPPPDLSYGYGGICFIPLDKMAEMQIGYSGSDWNPQWLVVAQDSLCGDPIFVDRSGPGFPVLSAPHGDGVWNATPVAPSWQVFLAAVETVRPFTKGREYPVALERSPLTETERVQVLQSLEDLLGPEPLDYWRLLLGQSDFDMPMAPHTPLPPEEAERLMAEALAALPPELREGMREIERHAREEAASRPRVTSLNDDAWRLIPDERLDAAVMAYINGRAFSQIGEPESLAALPRGFQIFHLSFILEAEVANGGFHQFFWNIPGQYLRQVPAALQALGANEAAVMFEQAWQVADQDSPRLAPFKADGSLQAFSASYRDSPLNAFDDPFMALAARFPALRVEYLKQRIEQFRE
ncbi:DMP19 family protein [Roseateles chitinivorans]|uniref:DMP19 family protein n=1 Tax=Roseateles chitinivorans TaxID=2917965 RepID=UPI003D66DD50